MENFFEKIKNDIITGAESGYFGGDNTPELTESEIVEHLDASAKEFKELAAMVAAEPLESLRDVEEIISAEKIIATGGEAAVEGLKQKGYAVKKMANRGMDKIIKVLKGLLGWFTGSSADFKKLSQTAKALNKRLDKVVMKADNDDNKITIKIYDVSALITLVERATGNKGRRNATGLNVAKDGNPLDTMHAIVGVLKRVDTNADLFTVNASDAAATKANIKAFNEGNYLDDVKDYLDGIKADDDEEVSQNSALSTVKGYLSEIADKMNFTNKSQKDLQKMISDIEKNLKGKNHKTPDTTDTDTERATKDAANVVAGECISAFATAMITYRKSALLAAKAAKKELNDIITLGYRIESLGNKSK